MLFSFLLIILTSAFLFYWKQMSSDVEFYDTFLGKEKLQVSDPDFVQIVYCKL